MNATPNDRQVHPASFRDPDGFVFREQGVLYRQVNLSCKDDYDQLMDSGLYAALQKKGLLVAHEEVAGASLPAPGYKLLRPALVDFVSYPYEWSFSQLRDAALRTLEIESLGLRHGMTLKDASAYNIQFIDGRPVLIDTLSFTRRTPGEPWLAYRQFCQHFLAPLALMAHRDVRLGQLLKNHIDGIPLDLASGLLPRRTWLSPGLLMHLHLHARMQQRHSGDGEALARGELRKPRISDTGLAGIIDSLRSTVSGLTWAASGTEWADYYDATNYTSDAFRRKQQIVSDMLGRVQPATVWDLGANTGHFTRVAQALGARAIAFDIDPAAVERNYLELRKSGATGPLPLVMDLTNPSPGLGWHHAERDSLVGRGPADCLMALALVHHLAISNNVPLERIARFMAALGRHLVIEFVPKSDSQVRHLLSSRADIFPDYDRAGFERAFGRCFEVLDSREVEGSERTLYLMRRREA